jgi:hypothetical protein
MGLQVDNRSGTPIVFHGGGMIGLRERHLTLPEHNVGAVILADADPGGLMLGPFRRGSLEVLPGKPDRGSRQGGTEFPRDPGQVLRAPDAACGR